MHHYANHAMWVLKAVLLTAAAACVGYWFVATQLKRLQPKPPPPPPLRIEVNVEPPHSTGTPQASGTLQPAATKP
jgi:hypothetical protein